MIGNNKKRGVALIWSLVLSAVLLLISSTMVTYIIKESQFSVKITDSAQAYSYAKSGFEWANYYIDDRNSLATPSNPTLANKEIDINNDGSVDVQISISGCVQNADTKEYESCLVESTGIFNYVTRKLEYRLAPTSMNSVNINTTNVGNTDVGLNTESFTMQFDFWSSTTAAPTFIAGLDDPDTGYFIAFEAKGKDIYIAYKGNGFQGTKLIGEIADLTNASRPYNYKVRIRYINDTAIQITVYERDASWEYDCIVYGTADVSGIDFGNLSSLTVPLSLYNSDSSGGIIGGYIYTLSIPSARISRIALSKQTVPAAAPEPNPITFSGDCVQGNSTSFTFTYMIDYRYGTYPDNKVYYDIYYGSGPSNLTFYASGTGYDGSLIGGDGDYGFFTVPTQIFSPESGVYLKITATSPDGPGQGTEEGYFYGSSCGFILP